MDHSGLEPLDVGELQPEVPLSEERHGGAGCRVRGSACGTPPADRVSAPFEVSVRVIANAPVALDDR
jgi:hypothetical protein